MEFLFLTFQASLNGLPQGLPRFLPSHALTHIFPSIHPASAHAVFSQVDKGLILFLICISLAVSDKLPLGACGHPCPGLET